ncbi:permease-like cell division protein FtsX [Ruicaihuangia caeni]|uniref:Cell division protein FtsX n=1 Tax=Ruicaihuangia caeni TaxID=3042517 RepID=A0AAW6T4V8_9MICO|nr:permease-like cell division protein FtsX [Klugiella sp. YN-L-19]MDI2097408.1 permease-like cell division protein FtsX [Klugiella sp. YN-L-19]
MRFGLVMHEVGQGLRRNISMVISVILVTFISLTFVGAAALLQLQITEMKGYWYDRAQVAVYLCTEVSNGGNCMLSAATEEQIDAVRAQLESDTLAPYIDRFEFENRDQAYENFQRQFQGNPVADLVEPEFLNETFWVNLKDPNQAAILVESLSTMAGVENVEDQRAYLDGIFDLLNAASITAVGIAALMLVAAVLLIATTIRLSAFSRRRELGIMRLVGASNGFIQTPFVLEGIVAALIGSALASATVVGLVHFFVQGYLAPSLAATTSLVGVPEALMVVPIIIGLGVLLAGISASFAIRRYLRI